MSIFKSENGDYALALTGSNLDCSQGDLFVKTITSNTVLTVSNTKPSGMVTSFVLKLINGGDFIITWWSGVAWENGTPPTLSTSGTDLLGFITHDGGITWSGLLLGLNVRTPS